MSDQIVDPSNAPEESQQSGFCSAICQNRECLQAAVRDPDPPSCPRNYPPKTSEVFHTCNLPKRFEHPHWFNGYGSQQNKQHPFYRTTSNDYGWYPPGYHSISTYYYPRNQTFTNAQAEFGMYKNYSLNVTPDDMV